MELELEHFLTLGLFIGARVAGLIAFAPFFGNLAIPVRVKAVLTLALTALFIPTYAPTATSVPAGHWVTAISGEVMVGLLIGLTMHFIFDGVRLAGHVVGFQLGFSLANLVDPHSQVDTPVISVFHQIVALLIFLQLNVHHWMLRGLAKSFDYVPVGVASPTAEATSGLLHMASGLWLVAIQIAAPVLIATMLTDVVLGFLSKASPQFPVLFIGHSVKAAVGVAVMLAAVVAWPGLLERYFFEALASTERLLRLAQ